ncbi:MAG TPA: hypothetical protein VNZ57_09055 [Longimicrobiales bacterium]|nr:hypothetical protein [Longimicrobiales bacterium]
MHDITIDDFLVPELVFQIGIEPRRINMLTSTDGVECDEAWPNRIHVRIGDVELPVVGLGS